MRVLLESDLPIAVSSAREAVAKALSRIAEVSRQGEVALAAATGPQHRETARLEVPVIVDIEPHEKPGDEDLPISIRARSASSTFPTFAGWISAIAAGPSATRVWLRGEYTVPFGLVGAAVNAVAFDRIAQESLRRLLALIIREANENIRHRAELDYQAAHRAGA